MAIGSDPSYTFVCSPIKIHEHFWGLAPNPMPLEPTGKSRPAINGIIKGSWLLVRSVSESGKLGEHVNIYLLTASAATQPFFSGRFFGRIQPKSSSSEKVGKLWIKFTKWLNEYISGLWHDTVDWKALDVFWLLGVRKLTLTPQKWCFWIEVPFF